MTAGTYRRRLKRQIRQRFNEASRASPRVAEFHRWARDQAQPRLRAAGRDSANRARHGPPSPRFAELIWISPRDVTLSAMGAGVRSSARVVRDWWPAGSMTPLEEDPVYRTAVARWVEGRPWDETGEIERMEQLLARKGPVKGLLTTDDIRRRCEDLDDLFATFEAEGRLRTQVELDPRAFREFGGIGMHLGPGGEPIRAENGRHRFAMAHILGLDRIPARIGMVHVSALPELPRLRSSPPS